MPFDNKVYYQVEIGECSNDDESDGGAVSVVMLEEIYNKIMNGEYSVSFQSDSNELLLVRDKKNNPIKLLGRESKALKELPHGKNKSNKRIRKKNI